LHKTVYYAYVSDVKMYNQIDARSSLYTIVVRSMKQANMQAKLL